MNKAKIEFNFNGSEVRKDMLISAIINLFGLLDKNISDVKFAFGDNTNPWEEDEKSESSEVKDE